MVDVERLDEIRRRIHDRAVQPAEGDLLRSTLHTSLVEHGLQQHAVPARIAHRAIAELAAGDAGVGKSAAIARALIDGNEVDRLELPEVFQRKLERMIDLAFDLEGKFIRIDIKRYARQMIADEKSVVRRNRSVV